MSAIKPKTNREVSSELDKPLPDIELRFDVKPELSSTILSEPFPTEILNHPETTTTIEPEPKEEKEGEPPNLNIITFNDVAANFDTSRSFNPLESNPKFKKGANVSEHLSSDDDYEDLPIDDRTIFQHLGQIIIQMFFKQGSNIRYGVVTEASQKNRTIAWAIYIGLWILVVLFLKKTILLTQ